MPIYFAELPFFDNTELEEEDVFEEDWEEFRRAFFGAGIVFLSKKLNSKEGKIISSLNRKVLSRSVQGVKFCCLLGHGHRLWRAVSYGSV